MAAPNRYAIRESGIATMYKIAADGSKGDALVQLDTLKMGEVETSGTTVYARGGRGNAKIVGFSSDREARVTLEDAIFSNAALAALTGNDVISGARKVEWSETLKVNASRKVTVAKTVDAVVSVYLLDTDGKTHKTKIIDNATTGWTRSAKEFTFGASSNVVEGDFVKIYYTTITDATAKTVKVTADMFGGTFYLVVDILVRDENSGKDYYGQFVAPRAKLEDNFSFSFSPDGDPSVLSLPIEILKDPRSTDMWELIIFDQDLVV
jgi:hypothetical protein